MVSITTVAAVGGGLSEGDLLFGVADEANAITAVTALEGLPVDHVAIYHEIGGLPFVLEAYPGHGVWLAPLDTMLSRGATVQARVDGADVAASVSRAMRRVGQPYDYLFDAEGETTYCSELVQQCFVDSTSRLIFEPIPMTFRDRDGQIPQQWIDLYAKHGRKVPEGAPGSNPAALLRHPHVSSIIRVQP